MEYMYSEKSWKESWNAGNVDEAVRRIEHQIAMNLMLVHNRFCENKMRVPDDVYGYKFYGKTVDAVAAEKMKPFISLNYDFIEIGHGLDFDSACPREIVLENYQNMEKTLQEAMCNL